MQPPSAVPEALLPTQPLPGPFIGEGAAGLGLGGDHGKAPAQEEKAARCCTGEAAWEMVQSWQGTPLSQHDPHPAWSRGTPHLGSVPTRGEDGAGANPPHVCFEGLQPPQPPLCVPLRGDYGSRVRV